MKKKIMIVGGCGFIGHNLALKLKNLKNEIIIVDSLAVNNLKDKIDQKIENSFLYNSILKERINLLNKNSIELKIEDSKNNTKMQKIFFEFKPDIIIHLAAVSHANKSNQDPNFTFDNSLLTLKNSLEGARLNHSHIIFLSSSMVYGEFPSGGVDENTICKPIGIYGNLKYASEIIIKSYAQVFKIPYTIIRPSALYGERCVSRRVGQIFIENAIQNKDISINGDGEDKLDFTYIDDLIQGIEMCCSNKNAINETFNITYGNARKINELLDLIKNEFPNIKTKYLKREKFMPIRGTLFNTKARKLLNFQPKFSIEDGYLNYIKWYKNFWKSIA